MPIFAGGRGVARSLRLLRAFRGERTDPDHYYSVLAADSVAQVGHYTGLTGATVLDVGGGPGYFAVAFHQAGARYVSVESSAGELATRGAPAPGSAPAARSHCRCAPARWTCASPRTYWNTWATPG